MRHRKVEQQQLRLVPGEDAQQLARVAHNGHHFAAVDEERSQALGDQWMVIRDDKTRACLHARVRRAACLQAPVRAAVRAGASLPVSIMNLPVIVVEARGDRAHGPRTTDSLSRGRSLTGSLGRELSGWSRFAPD